MAKVDNILQKKSFDLSPMGAIYIIMSFALFFVFLAFGQRIGGWITGVVTGATAPVTDTIAGINWGL